MKFKIHADRNNTEKAIFYYDNETNFLTDEDGNVFEDPQLIATSRSRPASIPFDKDNPLKKFKDVRVLKIQLGLSCNYGCTYCSQRFVPRADETSKKYVEGFLKKLDAFEFSEKEGLKIEFWGGEPLVYWKTLQPLVAGLNEKFKGWRKKPQFSMITNGSLLTDEICDWLFVNDFSVAISHDGPGQFVRGPDPFDDPEKKEIILRFWNKMHKYGRMSFNAMLNGQNTSRKAIYDYFVNLTGEESVNLGEGGLIDAYDEGGLALSLQTKQDHFNFRRQALTDILHNEGKVGFVGILQKIDDFTHAVLTHNSANGLGQKCGMDDEHVIAVDLRGNVVTCQNVSAVARSFNGELHYGGNIAGGIEKIAIRTAKHWRNRPDCASCPVLHLCQGSCMYLEGENWDMSCRNAYSDAVALMALSIEKITGGFVPYYIEADHLPLERQDIWGIMFEHPEDTPLPVKDVIIENEKMLVEGVEVFTQSRKVEK
jgi:uncharacterized protein